MKKYIYISIIILLFFSCKKEEESELWTEVEVTTTNFLTKEPITGVWVGVYERKMKGIGLFGESELIPLKVEYVDENGRFYHGFKAKRSTPKYSYEFFSSVNDISQYKQIYYFQFNYLKKGEKHVYDFEFLKYGLFSINMLNENCENENDELRFRYYYKANAEPQPDKGGKYIYIYSGYWSGELSWKGCVEIIGQSSHPQKLPAGEYVIEWKVTRDSGYTEGTDTFFVGEGDSAIYLLKY